MNVWNVMYIKEAMRGNILKLERYYYDTVNASESL